MSSRLLNTNPNNQIRYYGNKDKDANTRQEMKVVVINCDINQHSMTAHIYLHLNQTYFVVPAVIISKFKIYWVDSSIARILHCISVNVFCWHICVSAEYIHIYESMGDLINDRLNPRWSLIHIRFIIDTMCSWYVSNTTQVESHINSEIRWKIFYVLCSFWWEQSSWG